MRCWLEKAALQRACCSPGMELGTGLLRSPGLASGFGLGQPDGGGGREGLVCCGFLKHKAL